MKDNRWNIKNYDLKVGDWVEVEMVRSNLMDPENGIGWRAYNVTVQVIKVNDLTFIYEFNGEKHYELKNDVTKTNVKQTLFPETSKIIYEKDSMLYKYKSFFHSSINH